MRRFIQTVAVLSLIAPALIAQGSIDDQIRDVAGLDPKLAKGFLTHLKQALASGNKQAVSELIAYPISVSFQGKKREITSREEFEAPLCGNRYRQGCERRCKMSPMKI